MTEMVFPKSGTNLDLYNSEVNEFAQALHWRGSFSTSVNSGTALQEVGSFVIPASFIGSNAMFRYVIHNSTNCERIQILYSGATTGSMLDASATRHHNWLNDLFLTAGQNAMTFQQYGEEVISGISVLESKAFVIGSPLNIYVSVLTKANGTSVAGQMFGARAGLSFT